MWFDFVIIGVGVMGVMIVYVVVWYVGVLCIVVFDVWLVV